MRGTGSKFVVQCGVVVLVLMAASFSFGDWYGGNGYYYAYSQICPPYFALNPPVYYSYPVARTYGLYPFPYYGEIPNSPPVAAEPKTLVNRYVDQKPASESAYSSPQAVRIVNPYVEKAEGTSSVKQASWEEPDTVRPKVIYPAS